jgi:putative chitinase
MSIRSLQTKMGIKVDGVFGPTTLREAMKYYKMTPERAAHFFGQTSHETGAFKSFSENLNYSANGLQRIFRKYFPTEQLAVQYERNPEKIANRVYASRMGNGDEASGDGWKFRGRGALQLTGRSNYQLFADYIKNPQIMLNPDLVASDFAFESAIFFFDRNKLWEICDRGVNKDTILALTKRINGGTHGLEDRLQKTGAYYQQLEKKP